MSGALQQRLIQHVGCVSGVEWRCCVKDPRPTDAELLRVRGEASHVMLMRSLIACCRELGNLNQGTLPTWFTGFTKLEGL